MRCNSSPLHPPEPLRSPPASRPTGGCIRARKGEEGAALVIAIFLLAILLSLVVSLAGTAHVDLKASRNFVEDVQGSALVDAGIAHAMGLLLDDTDAGQDTLEDDWASLTAQGGSPYPLGEGIYQFEILDAGSRLNLNTATREQLLALPGMTEAAADAVIDWRDEDDNPEAQGAESDTYQGYPRSYLAKNAPLDTVDELLMVQGITPFLLYGDPSQEYVPGDGTTAAVEGAPLADFITVRSYERNETATATQRQDINAVSQQELQESEGVTLSQQQAQAIVEHRNQNRFQTVADLLDVQGLPRETVMRMIDLYTVSASNRTLEGRINVNTASYDVLMTLPEMTEEAANNIISNRPFETVGDLLDNSVMENDLFKQIVGKVSTKSSIYLIRVKAMARPGGRVVAAEALVERTPDGVQLLRRREVPRWPGWAGWGWSEEIRDAAIEE